MSNSNIHFLLFEHIDGLELFKIKNVEDFHKSNSKCSSKSYNDYMVLANSVEHVASYKIEDYKSIINACKKTEEKELNEYEEIVANFLKVNGVKILHCDKSLAKVCKALCIEYVKSMGVYRGIKANMDKIIKKETIYNKENTKDTHNKIRAAALEFSRNKIGAVKDDTYVVHVSYEIDQIEREMEELQKSLNSMTDLKYLEEDTKNNDEFFTERFYKIEENKNEQTINVTGTLVTLYNNKVDLYNKLTEHLTKKMKDIAPNTREIIGDRLLCKLMHRTGGILNYAMFPASTIQLLGSEKSLFNCLKNKGKTPKHGMIYTVVGRYIEDAKKAVGSDLEVDEKTIGKICRDLANKTSISAKIDCSSNENTNKYGVALRKEIQEKLERFFKEEKYESKKRTEDILIAVE